MLAQGEHEAGRTTILQAGPGKDVETARELFKEYAESLEFGLEFQDFARELASLPGEYAPPAGRLLLALVAERPVGCVALRRMGEGACEMKRLFVRPGFRGTRIGRALVEAIICEARAAGYRTMCLDTVPAMIAARSLYRSIGFVEIPPYRYNPIPGAIFMGMNLEPPREVPSVFSHHGTQE